MPQAVAPSLEEIGRRHGTDKSSEKHDYLSAYEAAFAPVRQDVRTLIEIGVFRGGSLLTWRDYFPNAQIVGIDIKPEMATHAGERIAIEIGSQDDGAFLKAVIEKYPDPDIIIDDGSHYWAHQIFSFRSLYPALKPGGIYVVEDLHTSRAVYGEKYGKPGQPTAVRFLTSLAASIAAAGAPVEHPDSGFARYVRAWTSEISFGPRYCIVRKKRR